MNWREIIKVRTTNGIEPYMISEFVSLFNTLISTSELAQGSFSINASVPTDLCVTLVWESALAKPEGSGLAHVLIQKLKEYGIVDHSVWIEKGSVRSAFREVA